MRRRRGDQQSARRHGDGEVERRGGEIEHVAATVWVLGREIDLQGSIGREYRGCQRDVVAVLAPLQCLDGVEKHPCRTLDGQADACCVGRIGWGCVQNGRRGLRKDDRIATVARTGEARLASVADRNGGRPHADVVTFAAVELVRDEGGFGANQTVDARAAQQRGKIRRGQERLVGSSSDQRFRTRGPAQRRWQGVRWTVARAMQQRRNQRGRIDRR